MDTRQSKQVEDAIEYLEVNYVPELGAAVRELVTDYRRVRKLNTDLAAQVTDLQAQVNAAQRQQG